MNTIIHFSPEFFICRIHLKQQYVGDKLLAEPDIISKYVETLGCNIAHNKNLYFIVLPKLLSTALEWALWNWNSMYLSCNNDWAAWQPTMWWPHGFWSRCRTRREKMGRERVTVPISHSAPEKDLVHASIKEMFTLSDYSPKDFESTNFKDVRRFNHLSYSYCHICSMVHFYSDCGRKISSKNYDEVVGTLNILLYIAHCSFSMSFAPSGTFVLWAVVMDQDADSKTSEF